MRFGGKRLNIIGENNHGEEQAFVDREIVTGYSNTTTTR